MKNNNASGVTVLLRWYALFVIVMMTTAFRASAQSTYYVNDNSTSGDVYTSAVGASGNPGTAAAPFATIADAIAAASAGDIIRVDAGTYAENVIVSKSLAIHGANSGINPNTGTRVSETVLVPALNEPGTGRLINLQANDVVINGFTLDGDNPALSGGTAIINGADANTARALNNKPVATNGLTFENNIVRNFTTTGVYLFPDGTQPNSSFNYIRYNHFVNMHYRGIYTQNEVDAEISHNIFTDVHTGIVISSVGTAASTGFTPKISNNTINLVHTGNTSRHMGISVNHRYNSASDALIENNTINAGSSILTRGDGIRMTSAVFSGGIKSINNVINGNNKLTTGYWVWNTDNLSEVSITGGSVSGITGRSVVVSNYDSAYAAYSYSSGNYLTVDNLSITTVGGGNGVCGYNFANANPGDVYIDIKNNSSLSGSGTGVLLNGARVNLTFSGSNPGTFSSALSNYIKLENAAATNPANEIDARNVVFGAATAGTSAIADNFLSEDKITHKVDDSTLGLVRVKTAELFVTTNSYANSFLSASIQRVIDAATAGDIVNVQAGTYAESLTINKSLTILGPNATTSPNTGSRVAEAILMPNNATAITGNAAGITVACKGLTVDMGNCVNDGNRFMNQNAKANTNWNFEKTIFKNAPSSTSGNWLLDGSSAGLVFGLNDNLFTQNKQSNGISIWTGSPVIVDIQNNVWENNGYTGLNLNYAQGVISGNTFRETRVVSLVAPLVWQDYQSGILLQWPTASNLEISQNTFTRVHNGITLWRGVAGPISIFGNVFNNTLRQSIFVSNSPSGGVFGDISAVSVYENSFLNYSGTLFEISNVRADNQVLNASCNWYGSASASTIASKINGNVTYSPWLSSGTDNDLVAKGFQPTPGTCIGTPVVASATFSDVLCNGASTGSVNLTHTGGVAPYTYSWSNGATTEDLNGVVAGTYTVTVTDAGGSTASASATISEPATAVSASSSVSGIILCNGGSTTVVVSATGGVAPYTGTGSFSTTAGAYSYTVTDANGCTASTSGSLSEPAALTLSVASTNVSCFGYANGTITATASAGSTVTVNGQPYNESATYGPGTYTVTATTPNADNSGVCTVTQTVTITQPALMTVSATRTNVTCNGAANGTITVTSNNPSAVITINSQPYVVGTQFGPGSYTILAVAPDGNNDGFCSAVTFATITQPTAVALNSTHVNVICNGASTGSVDLSVTGGTPPYSYTWSNGATTQDLSGIAAGTYTVTVNDANGTTFGCTATRTVTITQPTAVALTSTQTDILCNGASTGAIDLTVSGGTAPYTYSWSNGATTQDINGLVAGTYTVTVNDANGTTFGCTSTATVTIIQPAAVALSTDQVNVLCNGASTGSIDLSVSGGVAPYTYTWSNGATTQDLSGLAAGTYSVVVNDANGSTLGCTASTSVTIIEPSAVSVSTTQTNPVCNGAATGTVDLTVSGGVAPYTYTWSNGASTQDLSGLVAGTYTVVVNDANGSSNGCTATTSVTITHPSAVSLSSTQVNVLCNGASTGSVDLSVSGGTAPYTYSWSNGSTSQDLSGLAAGTYTVVVNDAAGSSNGCAATATITITEPSALSASNSSAGDILCGSSSTTITVSATGGVGPYTGTGDFTVNAGAYAYTVTDANGCTASTSGTVYYRPVANTTQGTYHTDIQSAINAATAGDAISICAGTYNELVTVSKRLTISGAGASTIINTATVGTKAFTVTASGSSAIDRVVIKDMAFTGPSNTGGSDAISFEPSAAGAYVTVENVSVTGHGQGVHFRSGTMNDAKILNSTLNGNGFGVRVASAVTSMDGLMIDGCTLNNNNSSAISVNPSGTVTNVNTNYTISNTTFANNSTAGVANQHDLSFFGFMGNATLSNVTLTSGNGTTQNSNSYGIVFSRGSGSGPLGTVTLSNVTVQGHVGKGALTFQKYSDLSGVTLNNVSLNNCVAPWGSLILDHTSSTGLLCGSTSHFRTISIWNTGGADASGVSFYHATTNTLLDRSSLADCFQIENQVAHKVDVSAIGFVRVKSGEVFVTTNSFAAPNTTTPSIQRGVDAASAGDILHVQAGTYPELISINKAIDLRGANYGIEGYGTRGAETVIEYPASATVGLQILNVTADNVSLDGFDIRYPDARFTAAGRYSYLWFSYGQNNITIRNNRMYSSEIPVYIYPSTAKSGLLIERNYINGGPFVNSSYARAMYIGNVAGIIQDNVIENAATGIQYLATDNTNASIIRRNTVSAYVAPLYHNVQNNGSASVTWEQNVVSPAPNMQTGLSTMVDGAYTTPQVFNGIYARSMGINGTGSDATVLFQNNTINAANPGSTTSTTFRAVWVRNCSATAVLNLSNNSFTGQTEGIYRNSDALSATINANCNWWGTAAAASVATAAGSANTYTPWLNSGTDSDGATIGFQPVVGACSGTSISLSSTSTAILCYGDATGAIDLTVSGGSAPYTYAWSNTSTSEDLSAIVAGSYSVTVTDANGSTATLSASVSQPAAALAASIAGTNVDCRGNATGAANLSVTGGTAPYSYSWNNTAITEDLSGLVAGSYSVVVTDANGCTTDASITITEPAADLSASISGTNVDCFGNATGAADLSVSGGTAPYTYSWSNTAVSQDLSNIVAGTYSVTVTDANGCTTSASVTITEPAAALAASVAGTNILCNGASTGAADVTVSGGTSPYTYSWSNGSTDEDLSSITAGAYTVTATDANGCTVSASVTLTEPSALVASNVKGVIACGDTTAVITVSATGGVAPYTGTGSFTITAGAYSYTVTDANGCTSTTSDSLFNYPVINVDLNVAYPTIQSAVDAAVAGNTIQICAGNYTENVTVNKRLTLDGAGASTVITSATAATPVITVTGSGANASSRMVIRDMKLVGATGDENTGSGILYAASAAAGYYTIENVEASGNAGSGVSFNNTASVTDVVISNSNFSSNGNGLRISSGVPSFDGLAMSGTQMNNNSWSAIRYNPLSNLSMVGSNFSITNCSFSDNSQAGISNLHDISFNGFKGNVSLSNVTVVSSNGPSSTHKSSAISFGHGSTAAPSGNISLSNVTVSGTVGRHAVAFSSYNDVNNISMSGVSLQNCVAPLGSVGASHTDTDPLNLGNTSLVSVTMQSTGGATATSATFHNASTLAALSASVIADCFTIEDQVTGAIDASGLGMVRFKANQAFVTPNSFSSPTTTAPSIQRAVDASASGDVIYVAAGTYNNKVTVTKSLAFNGAKFGQDARSRSTASGESIIDGTSLTGDAFKINNNVSNVVIDGFEIRNFAGSGATGDGNAVSSFTTSTSLIGSNNSTVRNNYIHDMGYNGVYVGSDNATATIMVRQSGWLVRYNKFANCNNTAVELTNVASSQVRDNDIAAPATLFSATGDAGNGIEIGARSFTKSSTTTTIDVTGNTFSGSYPAGGRAAISVLSRANQSASNATVSGLTISGNTINGASNARAAVLLVSETRNTGPATLVNVTVTGNVMDGNSNGVVIQDFKNGGTNATHSSLSITNNDIRNSVSNGVHVLANTSALGITVGSNKLTGNGGHALRNDGTDVLSATCNWYGSTASGVVTASISGSATFSPWIVNGTDFDLVTLGFQPVPGSCTGTLVNTTITSQVNVLCFGNSTGSINLTVSGGKPPYLYNWSNGVTIQDPSGLAAGTYTVTVTDANGSTSTISATITQPAAALSASTSGTNVLCFGNATGAADLSVSGGTTPYSYSWSTGATTEDLSGIVSGSYNVTVTDANGCTTSSGVTITQPAAALGGSVSGTNVDCNGNATGAADLSVTGGTAPYSYSWNNGATTQDLSGLVAGTYTVVITDANGCSATRSITITEPATLVASSSNTSVTCLGATSTITVSAVGGTAPYSGTGDYTVVAGTYSYTVTDANGCTSTTNITVSEADVVFPTITVPADITVGTDAGVCYATVASLGTPVTSDNCAVVSVTNNAPATYPVGTTTVTWTVVDPAGNTTTANQLVTVTNTLPALGAIQGTLTACVPYAAGSTTFSVAPISDGINSTVYNWTVPTGFTISAGQGTSSITVTWTSITLDPTIAGQISVIASTPCSTRTSNASVVYASTAPVTPPSISGPSRVCPGETVTYSVASVARASSYVWTVATGMTITAGAGTNVITVSVDGSYTGGNVTVAASNSCGTSPVRTRTTVFNTPNTPGAISGTTSGVCGLTQTYSIVAVSGASSYTWSVSGGTINSGQGTNSVSVSWTGSGTTGSIAVKSVNACGESALRTASINKIPARPEPIVGSTTPCGGTTQAYSVATVASASSYTWTVTAGGAISAGQGTKNITVDWTAGVTIGQTLAVRASNACGNSTNRTIAVSIQSCPREAMEAGSILSMTAYPNPATDFVNVYFTTANIAEYTIQLMDMSGRVLRNFDGESTEGVNNVPFEMSDLSSGMYLIVLDHDSSRQTIRLVVE